ncbi:MAG: hypothetical protein OEY49_08995 [Candidatus Heimdallarchaeota archaeon]|nr:hypothetical protein [Candidatus Heimdallarchaeota archaeon]
MIKDLLDTVQAPSRIILFSIILAFTYEYEEFQKIFVSSQTPDFIKIIVVISFIAFIIMSIKPIYYTLIIFYYFIFRLFIENGPTTDRLKTTLRSKLISQHIEILIFNVYQLLTLILFFSLITSSFEESPKAYDCTVICNSAGIYTIYSILIFVGVLFYNIYSNKINIFVKQIKLRYNKIHKLLDSRLISTIYIIIGLSIIISVIWLSLTIMQTPLQYFNQLILLALIIQSITTSIKIYEFIWVIKYFSMYEQYREPNGVGFTWINDISLRSPIVYTQSLFIRQDSINLIDKKIILENTDYTISLIKNLIENPSINILRTIFGTRKGLPYYLFIRQLDLTDSRCISKTASDLINYIDEGIANIIDNQHDVTLLFMELDKIVGIPDKISLQGELISLNHKKIDLHADLYRHYIEIRETINNGMDTISSFSSDVRNDNLNAIIDEIKIVTQKLILEKLYLKNYNAVISYLSEIKDELENIDKKLINYDSTPSSYYKIINNYNKSKNKFVTLCNDILEELNNRDNFVKSIIERYIHIEGKEGEEQIKIATGLILNYLNKNIVFSSNDIITLETYIEKIIEESEVLIPINTIYDKLRLKLDKEIYLMIRFDYFNHIIREKLEEIKNSQIFIKYNKRSHLIDN